MAEDPLSETTQNLQGRVRTFDIGSELQTYPKIAGREPLIERSKLHSMGVETSDPYNNCKDKCLIECFVSLMVVSISIRHFGICKLCFHIPLNSTIFPILKVKIEIYKRSSMKLKHLLFSKYGVINCSFSF